MELADHRTEIDRVDRELLQLFQQRMRISAEIAAYKREHQLPVLDSRREEEKLQAVRDSADPDLAVHCEALFRKLMEVSRAYQNDLLSQKR